MQVACGAENCPELAVEAVDERPLCRKHLIAQIYERLEVISVDIQNPQFHQKHAEATGRFLENCMRLSTDVACEAEPNDNLERAQLLDILLWASELHGRLRRGPRVPARIPVLVRCESPDQPWEEKTETRMLSLHGCQLVCRHDININDPLTCVRLDNRRRVEARVAWRRRKPSGEIEVGVEFLTDENFWGIQAGITASTLSKV